MEVVQQEDGAWCIQGITREQALIYIQELIAQVNDNSEEIVLFLDTDED